MNIDIGMQNEYIVNINISFNIPDFLYKKTDQYCHDHKITRDDFIVVAIKEKLERGDVG